MLSVLTCSSLFITCHFKQKLQICISTCLQSTLNYMGEDSLWTYWSACKKKLLATHTKQALLSFFFASSFTSALSVNIAYICERGITVHFKFKENSPFLIIWDKLQKPGFLISKFMKVFCCSTVNIFFFFNLHN